MGLRWASLGLQVTSIVAYRRPEKPIGGPWGANIGADGDLLVDYGGSFDFPVDWTPIIEREDQVIPMA